MTYRIITNGYRYRIEFISFLDGDWYPVHKHRGSPWKIKSPWETRWLWKARLRVWLETNVDAWHEKWIEPIWRRIEERVRECNDWSKPTVVDPLNPTMGKEAGHAD